MSAIFKKELRSYFTSMTGYAYMALFLIVVGIYFVVYNLNYGMSGFEYVLQSISFLFVILIPILTMRIIAEEKKQKTDQLLLTAPITAEKIVVGKYLAVLTVFLMGIGITMFYPLILTMFGEVNLTLSYVGIIGFALMGSAYLAVGMFISALTESQVIAAVVGFVVMLVTLLMPGLASLLPSDGRTAVIFFTFVILIICVIAYNMMHNLAVVLTFGIVCEAGLIVAYSLKPTLFDGAVTKTLSWFSAVERFDNLAMGNLDLSAVVYFISVIFLFVFLSIQSVKKRRWS